MSRGVRTDFLAPRYLLKVEGTKLEADVTRFVESVEFEEDEDAASKITIKINNHGFRFCDAKVFAEGNRLDLWMGYVGQPLVFMQRGTIVRPDPDFPRDGTPMMTVVAHDASRRLMDVPDDDRGKTYRKMRDSEIAEAVFREVGASAFTYRTSEVVTRTRKRGDTRWEFLRDLALRNGFQFWLRYDPIERADVGYFGPPWRGARDDLPSFQTEKYVLSYGTNEADALLLEFHPRMSLEGQDVKVKMTFTTLKSRRTREIEINVSKLGQRSQAEKVKFTGAASTDRIRKPLATGPAVRFQAFGERMDVIPDRRFHSPKEARHFAVAWFRAMEDEFVLGRGTALGLPKLRRGQIHRFVLPSTRLTGDWRIVGTTHRMESGCVYETEIRARRLPPRSVVQSVADITPARVTEAPL